jgi:hypothetical protein
VLKADNLTTFMCRLSRNLGALTSWNPQGLSRPVMGSLYVYEFGLQRTSDPYRCGASVVRVSSWRTAREGKDRLSLVHASTGSRGLFPMCPLRSTRLGRPKSLLS